MIDIKDGESNCFVKYFHAIGPPKTKIKTIKFAKTYFPKLKYFFLRLIILDMLPNTIDRKEIVIEIQRGPKRSGGTELTKNFESAGLIAISMRFSTSIVSMLKNWR